MTRDELKAALRLFGLGERASFQEIKTRDRELAKQLRPDELGPQGGASGGTGRARASWPTREGDEAFITVVRAMPGRIAMRSGFIIVAGPG
ncbi:MAG: hypothetical protein ACM32K_07225 [Syntrophaceae bacterium]